MQSFFYLWRVTGKQCYRDWNWQIFQAFENYSRTEVAHAAIQVRSWGVALRQAICAVMQPVA